MSVHEYSAGRLFRTSTSSRNVNRNGNATAAGLLIASWPVCTAIAALCAAWRAARSARTYARRRLSTRAARTRALAALLVLAAGTWATCRALFAPVVLYIDADDVDAYLVRTSPGAGGPDLYYNRTCEPTPAGGWGAGVAALVRVRRTVTDDELAAAARNVSPGGEWAPADCAPQHHVAVLVCYRDRAEHLRAFLVHVHEFLQRQNVARYRVYVVEQAAGVPFNRGKVFNAGYREVCARSAAGCFVFHDVDLLPEHPGNVYGCTSCPRHMCANLDVFDYRTPSGFGGVVALTREQFDAVNGYSNEYYGWGGEDDDLYWRVLHAGYRLCRFDALLSRYTMLRHDKSPYNPVRYQLLGYGRLRYASDGVRNVAYRLLAYEELPLYTHILVDV